MANIGVGKFDVIGDERDRRMSPPCRLLPRRGLNLGCCCGGRSIHATTPRKGTEPENSLGYISKRMERSKPSWQMGNQFALSLKPQPHQAWLKSTLLRVCRRLPPQLRVQTHLWLQYLRPSERWLNHPMRWGGLPDGGAIRQASYQVSNSTPIADESAGSSLSGNVITRGTMGALQAENNASAGGPRANPLGPTGRLAAPPIVLKPLGFVVKADGQFSAILSQDDEIYIVRQGDLFAGRYRALSVSADAVEALEEPPRQTVPLPFAASPAFPDSLSASAREAPSFVSGGECSGCKSNELGKVSGNVTEGHLHGTAVHPVIARSWPSPRWIEADGPATFIFQTLGYVQAQDGEVQAIVADGPETYLVKQGDTFADQYQATSVDPILVLAVKVPNGQDRGDIPFRPDRIRQPILHPRICNGIFHYPHPDGPSIGPEGSHSKNGLATLGIASGHTFHNVDLSGGPVFADLGVDLLSSASTGFDLQSHFFMADNPKVGF